MKTAKKKQTKEPALTIKEPTGYSMIFEPLRSDHSLNHIERALLWTLITASPNFKPTQRGLASLLKVSAPTIQKGINSLKAKGYLVIKNPGTKSATWELYQKPNFEPAKHPYETIKNNFKAIVEAFKEGLIDEAIKAGYLSREEKEALYKELIKASKKDLYNNEK